jgi:cell division protein FtsW
MAKKPRTGNLGSLDWPLLGATAGLLALGLMMVYSSTSDLGYQKYGDAAHFFKRQLIWLGIGLAVMFFAIRFPYRYWMNLSILIMAATLLLLLALVIIGGVAHDEQRRQLLGQSISPAELAKLAMIIYIGHWLSTREGVLRTVPYGLLPFTIMVGVIAGLVVAQPDISEAIVIVLVAMIMFSIGIIGGSATFAFVITKLPHAMERLQIHLGEIRDPLHGTNVQLTQGLLALGSGGALGYGAGSGRMKFGWLPAAHTDSIFAIAGEELGLVGCLLLIGLFAIIAYRGLRIAALAPDSFGQLLSAGITCWIVGQALMNVAVVTGTIPFTGIALPFVSVGGSSLVTSLLGIGIMLNVSRAVGAGAAGTALHQASNWKKATGMERGRS